jgi:hypothetical protein
MSEEDKVTKVESDDSGSSQQPNAAGPKAGEPANGDGGGDSREEVVSKEEYEKALRQINESQRLIGEQAREVGELRSFYDELTPLLEKLQNQPQLIKAILDDKLDANLAQAVLDGKVGIDTAKAVNKAHTEVKKSMSRSEYEQATPEDIERLVSAKVDELISKKTAQIDRSLSDIENRRMFEQRVEKFVENTPDFNEYASQVVQWLDDHPEQYDISVAYEAVKGKEVLTKAEESKKRQEAEAAKELAANAGGGIGSKAGGINAEKMLDRLIAPISDPNSY